MNNRARSAATVAAVVTAGIVVSWSYFVATVEARPQHQHTAQTEPDDPGVDPTDAHSARTGDAHDGDSADGHTEEGVVHLNETQRAAITLSEVEVRRGSLTTTVEIPGEVEWNADRLVHISPRVSGIVASVEKTLGDRVRAGDVLCVLDSREMGDAKMEYLADLSRFEVARADYDRAKTVYRNTKKLLAILDPEPTPEKALAAARDLAVGENKNKLLTSYTRMKVNLRNYKRNEQLLASKIASEAEFLEAQGAYEISRADYLSTREEISFDLELRFLRAEKDFKVAQMQMRNAERALHILGLSNEQTVDIAQHGEQVDTDIARATLASPMAGVIVDRHLTRGELVNTATRLYTIADPDTVWVIGRAYERNIRFLKPDQKTTIRLDAFPGQRFEGQVDYVASQLDPDTRTVQVRVVLANPRNQIRAGMFGTVAISVADATDAADRKGLLVPVDALQRIQGGFVVFQVVGPGEYKRIDVQVLKKSREFAEVTGAIAIGDKVVVGDTFVLKSEIGKGEMGEGHEH